MIYPILAMLTLLLLSPAAAWAQSRYPDPWTRTGVPVIEIATEGGADIASREVYTNVAYFGLNDPNTPENQLYRMEMGDRIRGRGNNTWNSNRALKKSYRLNFRRRTSLFGLEPARNWVLLAQHRDETLLYNAIAFELGRRFGLAFNHSYNFVDLYINGEYRGNYLLTEHRQVAPGRIEIDGRDGWLAEIDEYYDEEPKFRTAGYDLPVMIRSPRRDRSIPADDPVYDFIRNDINALTDAMASEKFPESGYRELLDINTVIAFLMINEIVANTDLSHPRSTFVHKDRDSPIRFGPLWDFDSGYGWHYESWLTHGVNDHFNFPNRRPPVHPFFRRFYEDPVFTAKFRETWNERYGDIASMLDFIDTMAIKLERSAELNFRRWWYKTLPPFTDQWPAQPVEFRASITRLKNWYRTRIHHLNAEFNGSDEFPPPLRVAAAAGSQEPPQAVIETECDPRPVTANREPPKARAPRRNRSRRAAASTPPPGNAEPAPE